MNRNAGLILIVAAIATLVPIASIAIASQPQLIVVSDKYYCTLAGYGQGNNACRSKLYSGVLALYPYLDSTNPPNSTICVGYMDTSGNGQCTEITGSGLGAYTGSGSWYCVWINFLQTYQVSITGTCTAYYD